LKASARNSMFMRSLIGKRRNTEASRLNNPGPLKALRGPLPNTPPLAPAVNGSIRGDWQNAPRHCRVWVCPFTVTVMVLGVTSNHEELPAPGPPMPCNMRNEPFTSGACVSPGAFSVVPPVIFNGEPLMTVRIVLTCQPPRNMLPTPDFNRSFPFPNGSS